MCTPSASLKVIEPDDDSRVPLEQYIVEMAGGSSTAIEPFYAATRAGVYGYALSILRNTHDAQDVMQEAYVRVYRSSEQYLPRGNPMPWVYAIVRNLALTQLRERQKMVEVGPETLDCVLPGNEQLTEDDRLILSAALDGLTPEESQIVILHAAAGFKHREIAELLQIPLSTAISKYHRALGKLRRTLEGDDQHE